MAMKLFVMMVVAAIAGELSSAIVANILPGRPIWNFTASCAAGMVVGWNWNYVWDTIVGDMYE